MKHNCPEGWVLVSNGVKECQTCGKVEIEDGSFILEDLPEDPDLDFKARRKSAKRIEEWFRSEMRKRIDRRPRKEKQ